MTSVRQPAATYIMAAHNAAATIAEAITSVQAQMVDNWELIVVDDASTDGTLEIARTFEPDPRVVVKTNATNLGAAASRNQAIAAARSDLVSVMDADDLCLPNRLGATLTMFADSPELVVVAGQLREFGAWGGPVPGNWVTNAADIAERQRRMKVPVPHPSSTFRRDAVLAVGGYDEACLRSEDYALYLRLGPVGMACSTEHFVDYRTRRPLSLSYAIESGRYAALARTRNVMTRRKPPRRAPRLPESAMVDARSVSQWLKRVWSERRALTA